MLRTNQTFEKTSMLIFIKIPSMSSYVPATCSPRNAFKFSYDHLYFSMKYVIHLDSTQFVLTPKSIEACDKFENSKS